MKRVQSIVYLLSIVLIFTGLYANQAPQDTGKPKENTSSDENCQPALVKGKVAPKPLYRDPVYDGAADPVLCWNYQEKKWLMFYTNRRANVADAEGVSWVHGTPIGIAESSDGGATWTYRCTANIGYKKG